MSEYKSGDRVRIKSGPFASFTGEVREVSPDGAAVKVEVEVFGRGTPLELSRDEVEAAGPNDGGSEKFFLSNN